MSANKITQEELKQIIDPGETTPEGRESVEGSIKENVEAGLKDLSVDKIGDMTSEDFLAAVLDKEKTDVFGALSTYLTEKIESEELSQGYMQHVKSGLRARIVSMIDDSQAHEKVKVKLRELFKGDELQGVESVEEVGPEAVANLSKVGQVDQQSNEDVPADSEGVEATESAEIDFETLFKSMTDEEALKSMELSELESLPDAVGSTDAVNIEIHLDEETVLLPTEENLDASMETVELNTLIADGLINKGLGMKGNKHYQEDGIAFNPDTRQFAVVDGMGGHGGSSLVTEKLCKGYKEMLKSDYDSVRRAISQADPFNEGGAVFVMGGIEQDNVLRGIFCGDARLMVVKPDGKFVFLTNEESDSTIGKGPFGRHNVETAFSANKQNQTFTSFEYPLETNDIVLAGSDGLWENLELAQISELIRACNRDGAFDVRRFVDQAEELVMQQQQKYKSGENQPFVKKDNMAILCVQHLGNSALRGEEVPDYSPIIKIRELADLSEQGRTLTAAQIDECVELIQNLDPQLYESHKTHVEILVVNLVYYADHNTINVLKDLLGLELTTDRILDQFQVGQKLKSYFDKKSNEGSLDEAPSQDVYTDQLDDLLDSLRNPDISPPLTPPPPPVDPFFIPNLDDAAFSQAPTPPPPPLFTLDGPGFDNENGRPATTNQEEIEPSFDGDYTGPDMGYAPSLDSLVDEFINVKSVYEVARKIEEKWDWESVYGVYNLRGMEVRDFDKIANDSGLAQDGETLLRNAAERIIHSLDLRLKQNAIRIEFDDITLEYTLNADGKVVSKEVDEEVVEAREGESTQAVILRAIKGLNTFKLHRLDPKIGGFLGVGSKKLSELLNDSEVDKDVVLGALVNQLYDKDLTFKRSNRYEYSSLIVDLEGYLLDKVRNNNIDSLTDKEAKMLMRLESADKGIHDSARRTLVYAKEYLRCNLELQASEIDSAPFAMLNQYSINPKDYLEVGALILNDSINPKVTMSLRNFRKFEQQITKRIQKMVTEDFDTQTTELFNGKGAFEYEKKVDFMLKHKLISSLEDLLKRGPINVTYNNRDMLQGLLAKSGAPKLLPVQDRWINSNATNYKLDLRDDESRENNSQLAEDLTQHAASDAFTGGDAKLVLENIKKAQISTLNSDIARSIIGKLNRLNLPNYETIKLKLDALIDACGYEKHEAALMKSCVEKNRNILSINDLNSLCKQGSESTWSDQLEAVARTLQAGNSLNLKVLNREPELALALAKTAVAKGLSTIELEDVTLTEWKTTWLNKYAKLGGADWLTSRVGFLEGLTTANAKRTLKTPDDDTIEVMQIVLPAAANKATGVDGSIDIDAFLKILADEFNADSIGGFDVPLDADLIKNFPKTSEICQKVFELLKSQAESELQLANLEGFDELFNKNPEYTQLLKHFNDMSPRILAKMIFVERAKDNKNRSDASLDANSLEDTIFERSASVHAKSLLDQLSDSGKATVEKLSDQVAVICLIIEEGLDWNVNVSDMKMELTEDQVQTIRDKLTNRSEARENGLKDNFENYLKGSQRNAVRRKPEGVTLRMQADEFVSEFLEDLSYECRHILDEINPTDRLLAINEFLDFNLIEDNGGMSDYAKVALAFYFDLRGDVGSERFEKDLRKKLEAIMIEEADLDLDEDHTEFDLESEYSRANREDVFKRQLYKKMLAKYGAENLKDPEVRNKFTNEVTMAMMQERLDRLEAKMEESTIVDKLEGAWKWCKKAGSVLLPAAACMTLVGLATSGFGAIGPWLLAKLGTAGSAVAASGLQSAFGSWTAAYGYGAFLAGGKTLQALSRVGLPPFFRGNKNMDEAAFDLMQHGGSMTMRNGELQVSNIDLSDRDNKRQIKKVRRQFKERKNSILKESKETIKLNLDAKTTRSTAIFETINNAYSTANFDQINSLKKSNNKLVGGTGVVAEQVGHFGFFWLTELIPAIMKRK